MSSYREKMREYLKDPQSTGKFEYGKWGALNAEQRQLIRRALDDLDHYDIIIKKLLKLNQDILNDYLDVDNRFWRALDYIKIYEEGMNTEQIFDLKKILEGKDEKSNT